MGQSAFGLYGTGWNVGGVRGPDFGRGCGRVEAAADGTDGGGAFDGVGWEAICVQCVSLWSDRGWESAGEGWGGCGSECFQAWGGTDDFCRSAAGAGDRSAAGGGAGVVDAKVGGGVGADSGEWRGGV